MDELLPCPFCGSDDVFCAASPKGVCLPNGFCMECGARGPIPKRKMGEVPSDEHEIEAARLWNTRAAIVALGQPASSLDTVMLGRFVAQYEEGAAGFFIDADDAQEVALQVKAALSLGTVIMDEIHGDTSIPTDVACKVYAAIKRATPIHQQT